MIIVRIFGGLGNQLFQYAAGKALAHQHNVELKLDVSLFESYNLRTFDLAQMGAPIWVASHDEIVALKATTSYQRLKARLAITSARKFYKEPHFHFDPNFYKLSGHVYLQGYFQSEKYFDPIRDIIRYHFNLAPIMPDHIKQKAKALQEQDSVAIHLRRGDYKNPEAAKIHGIIPIGYYQKAIELLKRKTAGARFYLFSDEPVTAITELNSQDLEVVSGAVTKTHFEDLYLMSHCRHNIIANSSFSWWAAWLNNNPEKIVIAPKRWFNQGPKDTQDLLPESWIKL